MIAENKVRVQVRIGWIGFKQLQGRRGIRIWIKQRISMSVLIMWRLPQFHVSLPANFPQAIETYYDVRWLDKRKETANTEKHNEKEVNFRGDVPPSSMPLVCQKECSTGGGFGEGFRCPCPGFRIVRPVKSWRRDRAGQSW